MPDQSSITGHKSKPSVSQSISTQNTVTGKSISTTIKKPKSQISGASLATSIVSETSFGISSSPGNSGSYARGDHTHGTPTDPVPTHEVLDTGIHGVGDNIIDSVEMRNEAITALYESILLQEEEQNIQTMALLNPLNSGYNLAILKTSVGYVSGTLGAGSLVYAYVTPQATIPTGGTELTPVSAMIGQIKGVGRAFTGSTLAGTPLILRPESTLGASLATTALGIDTCQDLVEGEIIVPPATSFVIQGVAAAGTTPLVILSVVWEEMLIA